MLVAAAVSSANSGRQGEGQGQGQGQVLCKATPKGVSFLHHLQSSFCFSIGDKSTVYSSSIYPSFRYGYQLICVSTCPSLHLLSLFTPILQGQTCPSKYACARSFLFLFQTWGPQQGFVSSLSGARFWLLLFRNRWDAQVAIEYLRGCRIGDPGAVRSGACPERGSPHPKQ